jgi:hypothetical protein
MVEYGEVAQATGADVFIIGAEFTSMEQYADQWRTLISAVREVYPDGQITYAANREVSSEFPWEAVDFISVDAFFALPLPDDASVEQMISVLQDQRGQILLDAEAVSLPLVFTEVGTTAQAGSFQRTWRWDHGTAPDHDAQARYYQAVCAVWRDHLQGLYWWKTTLFPAETGSAQALSGFDPFGKSAEQSIRDCF